MSSASGRGRTTTRRSRPSATRSLAACRSPSTIPPSPLRLVYIDDVVASLCGLLDAPVPDGADGFVAVEPEYATTVGALAETIRGFRDSRRQPDDAARGRRSRACAVCDLPELSCQSGPSPTTSRRHADPRGVFVEMLKTPDCGQFSYFTAHPGITRGEHYHHTKTEKFLVIKGRAHFGFRHIVTGERHELVVDGGERPRRRDGARLDAQHHQRRRRRTDRHAVGERGLRSKSA